MTLKKCNTCFLFFEKPNFSGTSGKCKLCRNSLLRKQRLERKDIVNEQSRKWYHSNKEKFRTTQKKYEKKIRELSFNDKVLHAKYLLKCARVRAKRFNVPFNITYSDIIIPDICPILGIKIFKNRLKVCQDSVTVDRIIPKLGYVKGNILVISMKANHIKNDANYEEILKVGNFLKNLMEERMTPEMKIKLKTLLIKHEDCKIFPYKDTFDNITIGIGRNLSGRGILPVEIELMFENDVNYFYSILADMFPWFLKLNEARQCALIDMCFMGTKAFLSFKKMIAALEKGDFERAALEVIDSKYESEVHQRAHDIAEIIRMGEL